MVTLSVVVADVVYSLDELPIFEFVLSNVHSKGSL